MPHRPGPESSTRRLVNQYAFLDYELAEQVNTLSASELNYMLSSMFNGIPEHIYAENPRGLVTKTGRHDGAYQSQPTILGFRAPAEHSYKWKREYLGWYFSTKRP